eukprot:scaffold5888_cov67-Attheya_sp.AAC.2
MRSSCIALAMAAVLLVSLELVTAETQMKQTQNERKRRLEEEAMKLWTPENIKNALPADRFLESRPTKKNNIGKKRKLERNKEKEVTDTIIETNKIELGNKVPKKRRTLIEGLGIFSPSKGSNIRSNIVSFEAELSTQNTTDVIFTFTDPNNKFYAFRGIPNNSSENLYSVSLPGFLGERGKWFYAVTVIDESGNKIQSERIKFFVRSSQDMSIGDTWPGVGMVQTAIGRVVFTMNTDGVREMFACTGTVVQDSKTDRSIVVTAAHCIYDDKQKQFAENALFIPNQAGTNANQTNLNCNDDPLGCWYMDSAVVHDHYTTKVFPRNRQWDYGYYVVGNDGHNHFGGPDNTTTGILDMDARAFPISFEKHDKGNDFTTVLGHTLKNDPVMSYCSEGITELNGNYMLPSCEMQGGSSGGPWFSPIDIQGFGKIVSVSSWGFKEKAGLAAPRFYGGSKAQCMFEYARNLSLDGNRGLSLKGEILTC